MLADIDDPPRSRLPGLLLGLALAVPVVAVFVGWLIPTFVGAVLGGAADFDSRLRARDAYMQAVCSQALDPIRDEKLCGCVLAVEFPALDCQANFRHWAVARQTEACSDPAVQKASLSYCTCVAAIGEAIAAAPEGERDAAAQGYDRCETLPDAFQLPPVESLVSTR